MGLDALVPPIIAAIGVVGAAVIGAHVQIDRSKHQQTKAELTAIKRRVKQLETRYSRPNQETPKP